MGWIKLHRKLLRNPIFRKPELLQLWIYLLLNACHEPTKQGGSYLQPGQLAVGCETVAHELGYPKTHKMSIWRWLKKLEKEGCIRLEARGTNTIVTICNWNVYQASANASQNRNTVVTNSLPTLNKSDTPTDTQSDTQSDTLNESRNPHGCKDCGHTTRKSDTPTDTQSDTPTDTNTRSIKEDIRKEKYIYPEEFELWWKEYPRHVEKKAAFNKWKARIKEGYSPTQLLEAAKAYANKCRKEGREERYIKHPATFLGPNKPFEEYLTSKNNEPQVDGFLRYIQLQQQAWEKANS